MTEKIKLKRAFKCWELEGGPYGRITVLARNKLRAKLRFRKATRDFLDKTELSLLSVCRYEEGDIYFFEGKKMTKRAIKDTLFWRKLKEEQEKRLNKILEDDSIKYCYLIKRGVYYRKNYKGYVDSKSFAGVYTKAKAVEEEKNCGGVSAIPINVEEHNQAIKDRVKELEENLIKDKNEKNELQQKDMA